MQDQIGKDGRLQKSMFPRQHNSNIDNINNLSGGIVCFKPISSICRCVAHLRRLMTSIDMNFPHLVERF